MLSECIIGKFHFFKLRNLLLYIVCLLDSYIAEPIQENCHKEAEIIIWRENSFYAAANPLAVREELKNLPLHFYQ